MGERDGKREKDMEEHRGTCINRNMDGRESVSQNVEECSQHERTCNVDDLHHDTKLFTNSPYAA